MTRRNIENMSEHSSPGCENEGTIMSPPPPQASPAARSPLGDAPSPPAMLATMTPVNVMELKKEMEEKRTSPLYNTHIKTEVMYEKDDDIYSHGIDKHDTPIDLIYEDGNKTVIYTTAPDQKGVEIYSSDNSGEITINNINHQIHGQQIANVLIDGNPSAMVSSSGDVNGSPPGAVSVVLQGNGQGLLHYPQNQVPTTTVLVLSELVEDMGGVPVVGLRFVFLIF